MSPRVSVRLLATQRDERLLELVAAGHERAFEALVLRYRRPLLAYCARLGLSHARAEDVVQQSLLKAWLAVREGTVVHDARPWLYRIAHNTAVNALRAGRGAEQLSELEPARLVAVGAEHEPERRIAARAALAEVAALPDMQRNVILMSAVAGHSHEEVASALGISSGAVRGLLYRARAALRGAAAALTPQPLIAWAAGAGAGAPASSTAGRIVEISSAGGGELAPALVKGAALGLTAALAAGAVLVPVHPAAHRPAHRPTSAQSGAGHQGAGPGAIDGNGGFGPAAASARSTPVSSSGAQPGAHGGSHRDRPGAGGGLRIDRTGSSREDHGPSGGSDGGSGGGSSSSGGDGGPRHDGAPMPVGVDGNSTSTSRDGPDGGAVNGDGRVEAGTGSHDGGGSETSTSGDGGSGGGSVGTTQPSGGQTQSDGSSSGPDGGGTSTSSASGTAST